MIAFTLVPARVASILVAQGVIGIVEPDCGVGPGRSRALLQRVTLHPCSSARFETAGSSCCGRSGEWSVPAAIRLISLAGDT